MRSHPCVTWLNKVLGKVYSSKFRFQNFFRNAANQNLKRSVNKSNYNSSNNFLNDCCCKESGHIPEAAGRCQLFWCYFLQLCQYSITQTFCEGQSANHGFVSNDFVCLPGQQSLIRTRSIDYWDCMRLEEDATSCCRCWIIPSSNYSIHVNDAVYL